MGTRNFAIQPCQSKLTFCKVKVNMNFAEFTRIFPNQFEPQ
jgi:hypothetical protein